MSARGRGCIIFAILVVVGIVFCGIVPFVVMPSAGIGMALPVIAVPGEVVTPGGLFGIDLTNTIIGTVLADILVIVFALLAWRASRGWTKEIPGRFQSFAETIVEGFYGFLSGIGGERLRTAPMLWPLVATIFLFLLAGNMLKLFPGVETVGKMHCAHVGFNGYPIVPGTMSDTSWLLYVDAALDSGTEQTEAMEHACVEYFDEKAYERLVIAPDAEVGAVIEELEAEKATLESQLATADAEAATEIEHQIEFVEMRIASAEQLEGIEPQIVALEAQVEEARAAEAGSSESADDHGAAEDDHSETAATDGEGEAAAEGEAAPLPETPAVTLAELEAQLADLETERNLALSQLHYPGATLALTPEQLERGAIPFVFHITPFVRGPATDLSLTIALAVLAVVLVQVYGVISQGPAYFEKFINVTALGNLNKKPMGAIDFLVGLIEIISEIGKIVSLAFRLFGNLFAGGVALMAISFLVALLVPGVIYGLEIIIGAVQALVFSVLTLVFSVQAMEGHHGDEHDDHAAAEAHH
ncbi:MAG: F0F1 ATP synthase subunit A [Chloroflexi bacterium]|nr:F0F1 ATP synthase subunit A [Chloroflexota bacterium]